MLPLKLFFVSSSSFEVLSQDIQLGLMTKTQIAKQQKRNIAYMCYLMTKHLKQDFLNAFFPSALLIVRIYRVISLRL